MFSIANACTLVWLLAVEERDIIEARALVKGCALWGQLVKWAEFTEASGDILTRFSAPQESEFTVRPPVQTALLLLWWTLMKWLYVKPLHLVVLSIRIHLYFFLNICSKWADFVSCATERFFTKNKSCRIKSASLLSICWTPPPVSWLCMWGTCLSLRDIYIKYANEIKKG